MLFGKKFFRLGTKLGPDVWQIFSWFWHGLLGYKGALAVLGALVLLLGSLFLLFHVLGGPFCFWSSSSALRGGQGCSAAPPYRVAAQLPATRLPAARLRATKLPYEEKSLNTKEFEKRIHGIDLALVQSLERVGLGSSQLKLQDLSFAEKDGQPVAVQTIVLHLSQAQKRLFLQYLDKFLADLVPGTGLSFVGGKGLVIQVDGFTSHRLFFEDQALSPSPGGRKKKLPELVIVIDDIGESVKQARELVSCFKDQVTLSILPFSTHTQEIVNFLQDRGIPYLLHLPMEPLSYPDADPGPGAIFVDMSGKEIIRTLDRDLSQVPGLIGVNNHMGSRFTANARKMALVLARLKERHLFFLDSLTNGKSKAGEVAGRLGVTCFRRDVFLDNEQDQGAIILQLQKAEHLAKKRGQAIAIGHPYKETLDALKIWSHTRDRDIRLCGLKLFLQEKELKLVSRRK